MILEVPGNQYFFDDENSTIPLEYDIDLPDEKTNLYQKLTGDTYNIFVNESKKIFEKYKTQCNPDNKKLIKYTEECDKVFGNNYTHGGYECGSDGKRSTKCVVSNCDSGYYLDRNNNQCIRHVCSSFSKSSSSDDDIVLMNPKNEGYFVKFSLTISYIAYYYS